MTPTTPTQGEMSRNRLALGERHDRIYGAGRAGELKMAEDVRAMLAAAPSEPVVGREEVDWATGFMERAAAMLGRGEMPAPGSTYAADWWRAHGVILSALHAGRFAENAKQAIDPRLTEWGYSTTDEAITHLGKLLADQAAFDGLASPDKMEKAR